MKKYSDEELAKIVKLLINKKFDSADKILSTFNSNIKRKFKSFHKRKLIDNEIEIGSLKIANDIYSDLGRITIEFIKTKLSKELIDKSYFQGIELDEYMDYLNELATELVKDLLQVKYNYIKKQIKKKK